MPPKEIDLFISHSNKDSDVATLIRKFLNESGFVCWKAPDDIMPGESWPRAILRAIGNSRAMVLVWSSQSISSPEVSKELTLAMRNNVAVVPFRLENVKAPAEWEYHLSTTNYFDAFDGDIKNYFEDFSLYLKNIVPIQFFPDQTEQKSSSHLNLQESNLNVANPVNTEKLQEVNHKDLCEFKTLKNNEQALTHTKPMDLAQPFLNITSLPTSPNNCKLSSHEPEHNKSILVSKKKSLFWAWVLILLFGAFGYCYISQRMGVLLMGILGSIGVLIGFPFWFIALFYIIPLCLLFIFGVDFNEDKLNKILLKIINKNINQSK